MAQHARTPVAAVDPAKLDRLAEVAIKVGLQLGPGKICC